MAGERETRQGREEVREGGSLSPLPCSLDAADLVTNCLVWKTEKQLPC